MRIVLGEACRFTKECAIFMLALLVVLILVTYVPGLVTFRPQLNMGR